MNIITLAIVMLVIVVWFVAFLLVQLEDDSSKIRAEYNEALKELQKENERFITSRKKFLHMKDHMDWHK